ncbi:MAG: toxin TcdB middle/N-terminal domain-containing protein [Candidatus Hydrogenedentota bacterium]
MLERETDPNGNVIRYLYTTFPGGENKNQVYISGIEFGAGAPPWDHFQFVHFAYEQRPDWSESCRSGFIIRTGMRVREATVGTQGLELPRHQQGDFNADGVTDNLDWLYRIAYDAHPHWSLVSSVREVGFDGVTEFPPLTMEYEVYLSPESASAEPAVVLSVNTPVHLMTREWVDFSDLNGDALPDILKTEPFGGPHSVVFNLGEGVDEDGNRAIVWSAPGTIGGDGRAHQVNLASNIGAIAQLVDMDGDGRADLAYKADANVYYFSNEPSGVAVAWGDRQRMDLYPNSPAPSVPYETPDAQSGDLNGDRRIDFIQSLSVGNQAYFRVWINLGGARFSRPFTVPQSEGWMFSQDHIEVTDFNGDSLADVVRITPTELQVRAGLGYGDFAPVVSVPIRDRSLTPEQLDRVALEDISGDGLVELVVERAAPGELWYWIGLGNYTLDHRHVFTDMPTFDSLNPAVRWADMNGSATQDIIYVQDSAERRMVTIDFGDIIGSYNFLTRMSNGIGRDIDLEYDVSTTYLLADAAAGKPWPDPLPFVATIVATIDTSDGIGNNYFTEFAYHNGFWHEETQTFIGFEAADEIIYGDDSAPALVRSHEFDVGRDVFAMRGKQLRLAAADEDGAVFWEETTEWQPRNLAIGNDGSPVVFPAATGLQRNELELGQGVPRRIQTEFEYDEFGNVLLRCELGIVEDDNPGAFNDETITATEYAYNVEQWLVDRPSNRIVANIDGDVVTRTEFYYDDETFSGTGLGEISKGNKTLERRWHDTATESGSVDAERYKYDEYGNIVAMFDPLAIADGGAVDDSAGHYRTIQYDDEFHTYAVAETVHLGEGREDLELRFTWDAGAGDVTSYTDLNGAITAYTHDALGRLERSVLPGDTDEFPTLEYEYQLAQAFGDGRLINFVETRLLDKIPGSAGDEKRDHYFISRDFSDGFARVVMKKSEAEPDPESGGPRAAVTEAALFNARGAPSISLQPYFSMGQGATLDELLEFEDVRADGWIGLFHGNGESIPLDFGNAFKVSTEYDAVLRHTRSTNADGTQRLMAFEPLVTIMSDENDLDPGSRYFGTTTVHHRDGLGRLVRVDENVRLTDAGLPSDELVSWSTSYSYRADGSLTQTVDSQGNARLQDYDGLGRKILLNDPDRGTFQYAYDAASNLIETVDAKTQRVTYTYDGADRVLTEDYHDEGRPYSANRVYDPSQPLSESNRPDVLYHYDTPAQPLPFGDGDEGAAENTRGLLAYVEDLAGETHTSYNARGRSAWVLKRVPDPRTGQLVSYKTDLAYDSQDRVVEMKYPDGDRTSFAYNDQFVLERIAGGAAANRNAEPFIVPFAEYGSSGQRTRFAFGNGVSVSYAYDPRARLVALDAVDSQGPGEPLLAYAYEFDGVSNITGIHDLRPEAVRAAGDPLRNSQTFEYDDLYRLASVGYAFHTPGQSIRDDGGIAYRYDRLGNLLSQTSGIEHSVRGHSVTELGELSYGGALGSSGRIGGTSNGPGPHALTLASSDSESRAFAYDSNGNMTSIDELNCTWDFQDRLVAAEDESMRAEYAYDYSGSRVLKKVRKKDGGEVGPLIDSTVYVGQHFEIRMGGQPVKYVFDGPTRIARVTGTLEPSSSRVQRFQLAQGWNLLGVAVMADDAALQLGIGSEPLIEAAFVWDTATGDYLPLTSESPLPPGFVFWLRAAAPLNRQIVGAPVELTANVLTLSHGLFAVPALESINLNTLLPDSAARAWSFDGYEQSWRPRFSGELAFLSDLPGFVPPGAPIFLEMADVEELSLPAPSQRILYYLQDHLGSSNLVADAEGRVVEETAFYPFGEPRARFEADAARSVTPNVYLFSQKERDAESNLQYFESRYLVASLARFNRVDPVVDNYPTAAMLDPQLQNTYSYARNNPVALQDPDGRFLNTAAAKTLLRQFNPFSDQATGNTTDTKAERKARVFGALKVKKGGDVPGGATTGSIPDFVQKELTSLSTNTKSSPTSILSLVVDAAEGIKKFAADKKIKLDVDQFLNAISFEKGKATDEDILAAISLDEDTSPLFAEAPTSKSGRVLKTDALKGVTRIQNTIRGLDLKKALAGFQDKLKTQGFDFDQTQVDSFAGKFLNEDSSVDNRNRERDNRRDDNP